MILFSAAAPPFMKNGFVLGCERTREAVVIDPGDEVPELLAFIHQRHLQPKAILLTHAHVDHVSGVGAAKADLAVPVWLHRADQPLYERAAAQGAMFGLAVEQPPPVDHYYCGDGPWGRFGDYDVSVHHTPGHCPGGVCLAVQRVGRSATPRGPVRRRHAVCRVHRPHGLAWRQPPDADALHHGGAFPFPGRGRGVPGTAPKRPSAASRRPTRSSWTGSKEA